MDIFNLEKNVIVWIGWLGVFFKIFILNPSRGTSSMLWCLSFGPSRKRRQISNRRCIRAFPIIGNILSLFQVLFWMPQCCIIETAIEILWFCGNNWSLNVVTQHLSLSIQWRLSQSYIHSNGELGGIARSHFFLDLEIHQKIPFPHSQLLLACKAFSRLQDCLWHVLLGHFK